MKVSYLSFCILFITLISCKKQGTLKISVIDLATEEISNDLEVHVDEMLDNLTTKKIYWGESNGNILITQKFNPNHKFIITLMLPSSSNFEYYYDKRVDTVAYGSPEWNKGIVFHFAKAVSFPLIFHNVNCQGASDTLIYDFHPEYLEKYIRDTLTGCSFTNYNFYVYAGNWKGSWKVIRGGITTYHDTTFNLNENIPDIIIEY